MIVQYLLFISINVFWILTVWHVLLCNRTAKRNKTWALVLKECMMISILFSPYLRYLMLFDVFTCFGHCCVSIDCYCSLSFKYVKTFFVSVTVELALDCGSEDRLNPGLVIYYPNNSNFFSVSWSLKTYSRVCKHLELLYKLYRWNLNMRKTDILNTDNKKNLMIIAYLNCFIKVYGIHGFIIIISEFSLVENKPDDFTNKMIFSIHWALNLSFMASWLVPISYFP